MTDYKKDYSYINYEKLIMLKKALQENMKDKRYHAALVDCEEILKLKPEDQEVVFYSKLCKAEQVRALNTREDIKIFEDYMYQEMGAVRNLPLDKKKEVYQKITKEMVAYVERCEKDIQHLADEKGNVSQALKERGNKLYELLINLAGILLKDTQMVDIASELLSDSKKICDENLFIEGSEGKKSEKVKKAWQVVLTTVVILLVCYALFKPPVVSPDLMDENPSDPSKVITVAYYENKEYVSGKGTRYVTGHPLEDVLDACAHPAKNPVLVLADGLNQAEISYHRYPISFPELEERGMKVHLTNAKKEKNLENVLAKEYEFSEDGCQELLKDIFTHMKKSQMFDEYSSEYIYKPVLKKLPEFQMSEEAINCYYTYIQIRFKGMTYLYNVYMDSADGDLITSISAEVVGLRYLSGDSDEAKEHLSDMDDEFTANQLMFAEAAEHVLSGKHSIGHWLDVSSGNTSDVSLIYQSDNGKWVETGRFYESDEPGENFNNWQGSNVLKFEFALNKHEKTES